MKHSFVYELLSILVFLIVFFIIVFLWSDGLRVHEAELRSQLAVQEEQEQLTELRQEYNALVKTFPNCIFFWFTGLNAVVITPDSTENK
jgi:hypothetical protein